MNHGHARDLSRNTRSHHQVASSCDGMTTATSRTAVGAQRNAADVVGPNLDGALSQQIG